MFNFRTPGMFQWQMGHSPPLKKKMKEKKKEEREGGGAAFHLSIKHIGIHSFAC